ncbi:ABC transporter ATP-binding protein/permease [Ferrovibrio sp.]|uniref:ABC transporter ATP-binding protein/permease n=1 Tax=Ferrovibrio sp. TaxID=1917215 RepID=UPI0025C5FA9F|nr:ABC transporter ATP-binding protein/permease [Ferrovibrio sp.]MBX3456390.1 ABC transporter ATP-binding protein/permease [Ferrovibrio sp.]
MNTFRSLAAEFWALTKPYWAQSDDRFKAFGLLAAVIVLNLASVALSVWFNSWYNDFYNALQEKNFDDFKRLLLMFSLVAAAFIVVAVYKQYLGQMLQLRWRTWLTEQWLAEWLADRRFYRVQVFGNDATDNPDQRLAEDLKLFTTYSLSLGIGLMNAVVTLFSFLGILWTLSGDFSITLGGHDISIPGYMVWAALFYAIIGTWLTNRIGRRLIDLNFVQQRFEADFRFHLVRVRENAEGIALQHGAAVERSGLLGRFTSVVGNYLAIMLKQKQLTWFTAGYGQLALIFPFVVCAPRFFGGSMQLGGLMQTVSAFGEVQVALSYLINAYTDIAEWRAVMDRLTGFRAGLHRADALASQSRIVQQPSHDGGVALHDLALQRPDGRALLRADDLHLAAGERLLVTGKSGGGKSTLLRAIAGLWPFGEGQVHRPKDEDCLFLPQRPYLPLGSLRAALAYPQPADSYADADVKAALHVLDLDGLVPRLDEEANWAQILSGGEQQRVQLVRALLCKPAWLFLDEATAALDETSQSRALQALRQHLPQTGIISIGHRGALQAAHDKLVRLEAPQAAGSLAILSAPIPT